MTSVYRNSEPQRANFDSESDFREALVEWYRDHHEQVIRERIEAERQANVSEAICEHDNYIDQLNADNDFVDADVSDEALELWGNYYE